MTKIKSNPGQREAVPIQTAEDDFKGALSLPPVSFPTLSASPSSKPQTKKKRWSWILLIIIGLAIVASILVELICGNSICAYLRQSNELMDKFMTALLPLFSAASVSKVAETIGVCSVLIGWIYASLDKTELGIRYGRLADLRLPGYHVYVAIHFISVLLCIWLSAAKLVESAVLVLCGVLYNSWLQWDVLRWVVLSSKLRQDLTMEVWRNQTDNAENAKNSKELALEIAEIIAEKDIGETAPLQKELVRALLRYEKQCQAEDENKGLECAIEEISWIFGYLFQRKQKNEQVLLSRHVFSYCKEVGGNYGAVCAGYVLWQIKDKVAKCEQAGKSEEEALAEARNSLEIVAQGEIKKNFPDILRNWHMIVVAFTLVLTLNGIIRLDRDLLKTWKIEKTPCPEQDRVLLWAVAGAYFGESAWEDSLSNAISLMWKN